MILCLGPVNSGKTLLLKRMQNLDEIDSTASSVSTVGVNIFNISFERELKQTKNGKNDDDENIKIIKKTHQIQIKELGGSIASLWNKYLTENVKKIIYVVDASNLCQISAAGILLYTILANSAVQNAKVLLVLSKMDVSYRQMRNEALLMLQYTKLKAILKDRIEVLECSAFNGDGINQIQDWLIDSLIITN